MRAVVSEGTFEAAARVLHVTPSAVSQRIKALETAAGRVLLIRTKPVRMTPSGEALLRLARQVETLVTDTGLELGAGSRGESPGEEAPARPMVVPSPSTPTRSPPGCSPRWRRWRAHCPSTSTGKTRSTPSPCCATAA